jgi:hypothetical protein
VPGAGSCAVGSGSPPPLDEMLIANTRLETELDGLHRALRSRAAIEQAKGVLMTVSRCSEADAFARLARLSQQRNVPVRVLAETLLQLAATGFEVSTEDGGLTGWLRDQLVALGTQAKAGDQPRPPRTRQRPS